MEKKALKRVYNADTVEVLRNMNYQLDRDKLRDRYYQKLIGIVIGEATDQSPRLCGSLAHKIGVTYDSQREHLESQAPSYMKAMMESLMDSIDNGVENFYVSRNGIFRTSEEQLPIAMEAAVEAMDSEDGGSTLAGVLSDFLSTLQNFSPTQIKEMSKYVLELEQENQNQEKQEMLDENAEMEEEGKSEDEGSSDDPFGEGGDSGNEEGAGAEEGGDGEDPFGDAEGGSDDSNPFGDDGGNDGADGNSQDGSNPFGEGESEGNPFEGEDSGSGNAGAQGGSEGSNEGSDNNDQNASEDSEGSSNPFESIQSVSFMKLRNGKRPFIGLENGDLSNFCVAATESIFADELKSKFTEFGVESAEYQDIVAKYKKTNKVLMESVISVLGMCAVLGLKPNMDMIKFPDLYSDEFKY